MTAAAATLIRLPLFPPAADEETETEGPAPPSTLVPDRGASRERLYGGARRCTSPCREVSLKPVKGTKTMLEEIRDHAAELERVCRRYGVLRLELFGSAVSGRYRQGESDLDFLVEFEALPRGAYADAYFGLLEALEDLFGRPVDLVVDSAVKNPYFRESIESNKALLYAA